MSKDFMTECFKSYLQRLTPDLTELMCQNFIQTWINDEDQASGRSESLQPWKEISTELQTAQITSDGCKSSTDGQQEQSEKAPLLSGNMPFAIKEEESPIEASVTSKASRPNASPEAKQLSLSPTSLMPSFMHDTAERPSDSKEPHD